MVRIEKIQIKDLYEFSRRIYDNSCSTDIIPITPHRALAYANNPYADPSDIGLLVVYIENRCIGYLGIMPGLLKVKDRFVKVYWFSTFFVTPELRKKGIGQLLIQNAFLLNYDFVVSPLRNSMSENVFRRSGMQEFGLLQYYALDFRILNFLTLPFRLLRELIRKVKIESQVINLIIRALDRICLPFITNIFYGLLTDSYKAKAQNGIIEKLESREVDKILEDDLNLKGYNASPVEFYRGVGVINWMLQYEWPRQISKAAPGDFRYHFSELREFFKFITLKIYVGAAQDYKGLLLLSVSSQKSHTTLKVLDLYTSNHYDYIAFLVLRYAALYKATYIEFPDILAPYIIRNTCRLKLILLKKRRSYFYYTRDKNSLLANLSSEISLNYYDGDNAFF